MGSTGSPTESRFAWARTPTARAAIFHGVFVASVTGLKSATNALYLAHRPAEGLPLLYVLVATLMAVCTAAIAGPLAKHPPPTLLRRASVAATVVTASLALLFWLGFKHVLGALYVVGELYATTLSILFWSTVSGWFDARSARKAFALISAGGMAGSMVGGIAVRGVVALLGSVGLAACAALLATLALPLLRTDVKVSTTTSSRSLFAGARYLWRNRYPRSVAMLAATYSALGACVDYVFRAQSASRLSEGELASLFGDLNALVGAGSIAYQLLVSSRVLERGGLFLFLSIVPILLAAAGGAAALTGAFSVVITIKALEMAGSYSIQQSGMQLLYNPMPPDARPAVRAFVDGLVKKAGMASAGVALAVLVGIVPGVSSPWMVSGLALACLVMIRWLRGAYLVALEDKLRGSRSAVVTPVIHVEDKVTRAALVRALSSESGPQVLAALNLLRRDAYFSPLDHLGALLTHDDESVRLAALELIPPEPPPDVEFALTSILALDARRPRAAAARAFARCHPERAAQALMPYLHDKDPGVSCAVISALWALPDAKRVASEKLGEILERRRDAGAAERREVARLLGDLPIEAAVDALRFYVEDPDSSVRLLALQSAARVHHAAVQAGRVDEVLRNVDAIEDRLAHRPDRPHARAALVELGDAVVPMLRENLDDRRLQLAVRIEIPRLLRSIGTKDAAAALLFSNVNDHPSLRYRIAESLFQLKRAHPDVEIDAKRADEACLRRLAAFEQYRPLCHALTAADETAPRGGPARRAWDVLRHITADRLMQNLEMTLHLLGLTRGAERMDRAARALIEYERRALAGLPLDEVHAMRADALEILDVALSGDDIKADVMRVLEPAPPARDSFEVSFTSVVDTARALRVSRDPLVAALAQRVLRSGVLTPDEPSIPKDLAVIRSLTPHSAAVSAMVSDPTDHEEVVNMDESLVTRILTLEHVDLFRGLPVDDVAAIAGIADEVHAEPGQVLYKEGESGDTMMVLVSGRVTLTRAGKDFMDLGPGESIGQVSLLDRGPRPTTATVWKNPLGAELLSIRNDAFMDLVADRPELQKGLFGVLGKRLRALIDLQAQDAKGGKATKAAG